MKRSTVTLLGLLASTSLGYGLVPHAAIAQQAQGTPQADQSDQSGGLEEIVVTATRREERINKIPLSITAVSTAQMNEEGVKQLSDLAGLVPALTVTGSSSNPLISIRGLQQSGAVTPTTGIYLDDTPLQKRTVQGTVGNSNPGTPVPGIFDLDRVEVLRGPQGTLYGGGSEGGTIRYIMPAPSLTTFSGTVEDQISATTKDSAVGYDSGFAVGGPIVQDVLGFRAAVYFRRAPGWIDIVSPFTGQVTHPDANDTKDVSGRLAFAWAPNDNSKVTLSVYATRSQDDDGPGAAYNLPLNGTFSVPVTCYNTSALSAANPSNNPAPVSCSSAGVTYRRPALTFGPYSFGGPYTDYNDVSVPVSTTKLKVGTATIDYDFDIFSVKSITSYITDQTTSIYYNMAQMTPVTTTGSTFTTSAGAVFNVPQGSALPLLALTNGYPGGQVASVNQRHGVIEELRFSSANEPDDRLTWTAGLYVSDIPSSSHYVTLEAADTISQAAYGISAVQRYGVGVPPNGSTSTRDQELTDYEYAAYGEANYEVIDDLKLIAGIRKSEVKFNFFQQFFGTINKSFNPLQVPGGLTQGTVTQYPLTPKGGIDYQVTPDVLLYTTAAKGFRAGGVNSPLSPTICGPALAAAGLTLGQLPTTYQSDSVWSYEAGGKFRLFDGLMQVNASAYDIQESGLQLNFSLGGTCGETYTTNAGKAESKGFELEITARPVESLTVGVSGGYDDDEYTQTVYGPMGTAGRPVIVESGQAVPIPPWTISANARYDFTVMAHNLYVFGDYRYSAHYAAVPFGESAWSPDALGGAATSRVDLRIGTQLDNLDVNFFVNNLLNNLDGNITGETRGGCSTTIPNCPTYTTYNPVQTESPVNRVRELGVQATYKF